MNKRQAGAFWEEAVTAYLMRSGVNILERNYRCSYRVSPGLPCFF